MCCRESAAVLLGKAVAFPPVLHPASSPTERKYQRVLLKQCGFNLRGVRAFKTAAQFLPQPLRSFLPLNALIHSWGFTLQQIVQNPLFYLLSPSVFNHLLFFFSSPSVSSLFGSHRVTVANGLATLCDIWTSAKHRNSLNLDAPLFTLQASAQIKHGLQPLIWQDHHRRRKPRVGLWSVTGDQSQQMINKTQLKDTLDVFSCQFRIRLCCIIGRPGRHADLPEKRHVNFGFL